MLIRGYMNPLLIVFGYMVSLEVGEAEKMGLNEGSHSLPYCESHKILITTM